MREHSRPAWRSLGHGPPQLDEIPAKASTLPRQARTQEGPTRRRPRPTSMAKQSRMPQADPPWEGPYVVAEVLKLGTYKLADEKGTVFTNALEHWTTTSLLPLEPRSFVLSMHFVPLGHLEWMKIFSTIYIVIPSLDNKVSLDYTPS